MYFTNRLNKTGRLSLALTFRGKICRSLKTKSTFEIQTRSGPSLLIDDLGNVTKSSSSSSSRITSEHQHTNVALTNSSSSLSSTSYAFISYLLPSGYPTTVAPSYSRYALFSFLASTASSAGSVLAMQSLLIAVGVGSNVAVPAAAALNWVLKDGLGQAGGVAFAALIGNRFDADPKRWRLVSALVLDSATFLEVCSPLFGPKLFLPVAAVANFLKNVAWLTASATRAGIHQALAIRGNLADLTAKAASQSIAASTLGTAIGIGLSTSIVGSTTTSVLAIFAVASLMHISGVAYSLRSVVIPTLSAARMDFAVDDWIRFVAKKELTEITMAMITKKRTSQKNFLPEDDVNEHDADNVVDETTTRPSTSPLIVCVKTPEEVAKEETFYPWETEGRSTSSSSFFFSSSSSISNACCHIQVSTGNVSKIENLRQSIEICSSTNPSLSSASLSSTTTTTSSVKEGEGLLGENINPPRYLVGLSSTSMRKRGGNDVVQLHFTESADWNDVLTGYINAMRLRAEIDILNSSKSNKNEEEVEEDVVINQTSLQSTSQQENLGPRKTSCQSTSQQEWRQEAVHRSRAWTMTNAQSVINALDAKGWWVGTPLIDVSPELRIFINVNNKTHTQQ